MSNKTVDSRPSKMVPPRYLGRVMNQLYSRAVRLSGNASDAWDLVQDTLERGLRKCPNALTSTDDAPWLYTVLKNLHLDQVRSAQWRAGIRADADLVDLLPAPEPPELPFWRTVDPVHVRRGMRRLQPELRQVLVLQSRQLSLRQIAGVLHLQPVTAGTRAHRARRRLRAILTEGEGVTSRQGARSPE